MPLLPGKGNMGANIKELMNTGRPQKQAIAIAYSVAARGKAKPPGKRLARPKGSMKLQPPGD